MGRVSQVVMLLGVLTFLGAGLQGGPWSAAIGLAMVAQYPAQTFYRGYKDGRESEP